MPTAASYEAEEVRVGYRHKVSVYIGHEAFDKAASAQAADWLFRPETRTLVAAVVENITAGWALNLLGLPTANVGVVTGAWAAMYLAGQCTDEQDRMDPAALAHALR